jgi:hypothetical protein
VNQLKLIRSEFSSQGEECCTFQQAYAYAAEMTSRLRQQVAMLEIQVFAKTELQNDESIDPSDPDDAVDAEMTADQLNESLSRALLVRCRNKLSHPDFWLAEPKAKESQIRLYTDIQSFLDNTRNHGTADDQCES